MEVYKGGGAHESSQINESPPGGGKPQRQAFDMLRDDQPDRRRTKAKAAESVSARCPARDYGSGRLRSGSSRLRAVDYERGHHRGVGRRGSWIRQRCLRTSALQQWILKYLIHHHELSLDENWMLTGGNPSPHLNPCHAGMSS